MNDRLAVDSKKREGIAIIVVLGLLSLLMILAVAFSTSMRVERAGAGSFSKSVFIRHVEAAAISRAMKDIDEALSMQTNATECLFYPNWNNGIFASVGAGSSAGTVSLGWGKALDYIPDSMTSAVAATTADWVEMQDSTAGNVVGCCAYLAIDCSGLLDINRVGGMLRGLGTNAAEIHLAGDGGGIPEFQTISDFQVFTNGRAHFGLYADVREFRELNENLGLDRSLTSFSSYSLAPEQKYRLQNGNLDDKVYVGGTEAELKTAAKRADIIRGFQDSGLSLAAAGALYTNLVDYVDADGIPWNLASGTTEQVPMINEVSVKVAAQCKNGFFTCWYEPTVELIYPFDTTKPGTYNIHYEIRLTPFGENTDAALATTNIVVDDVWGGGAFYTATAPLGMIKVATNAVVNPSNVKIQFMARVKAEITLNGVQQVDLAPCPQGADPTKWLRFEQINVLAVPLNGARVEDDSAWTECVDPRFNWRASGAGGIQWLSGVQQSGMGGFTPAPSPGAMNNLTRYFADAANATAFNDNFLGIADGSIDSRVADRPLVTPGELGCLAFAPLQTVRLYDQCKVGPPGDPAYHKVLDVFSCLPPNVTERRGLVNINSTDPNVLAAAFCMAPKREYITPPEPGLNWATAKTIGETIVANHWYTNLSDIGRITNWPTFSGSQSELVNEALIRNSSGLLTTRQNLFVLLIASGATYKGVGATGQRSLTGMLSHRRAVALIWRDAYPDAKNNHAWLVNYVRLIDE